MDKKRVIGILIILFTNFLNPNGPADKAGLSPGDTIVSIEGIAVTTPDVIAGRVKETLPGTTLTFEIMREEKMFTIPVIIEQWN